MASGGGKTNREGGYRMYPPPPRKFDVDSQHAVFFCYVSPASNMASCWVSMLNFRGRFQTYLVPFS